MEFLVVYIREAHALDGAMPMGGKGAPLVEEPLSIEERREVARACSGALDMSPLRMLIDDMKDTACKAYAAWPDRLYLVGVDGLVAFAGARGPRGFQPDALEDAIRVELGLPPLPRKPDEDPEREGGRERR